MPRPIAKLGAGYDLAFSSDGQYLATMPSTSSAKLFNTSDWKQAATLKGVKYPRHVFFLRDSSTALVASIRSQVATFSIPDGELLRKWRTPHGERGAMTLTPDGRYLIVSARERLHFFALDSGEEVDQTPLGDDELHQRGDIRGAAFSQDGKHLAVLWSSTDLEGPRTQLTVWSWPSRSAVYDFRVEMGARQCGLKTREGTASICTAAGGNGIWGARAIEEWNLSERVSRELYSSTIPGEIKGFNFSFSPCGERLVVISDGAVVVYTSDAEKEVARLELDADQRIFSAQLTPDLKHLVTGTSAVHVWRMEDLRVA